MAVTWVEVNEPHIPKRKKQPSETQTPGNGVDAPRFLLPYVFRIRSWGIQRNETFVSIEPQWSPSHNPWPCTFLRFSTARHFILNVRAGNLPFSTAPPLPRSAGVPLPLELRGAGAPPAARGRPPLHPRRTGRRPTPSPSLVVGHAGLCPGGLALAPDLP